MPHIAGGCALRQRVKYAKESIFSTAYGSGAEQQECIRVMRDSRREPDRAAQQYFPCYM